MSILADSRRHKLGTLTYHTLSKVMISYDKRVAVLPSFVSFSFLLLGLALPSFSGLALPSLGFGLSLSFALTLEEVNCGITREPTYPETLLLHHIFIKKCFSY